MVWMRKQWVIVRSEGKRYEWWAPLDGNESENEEKNGERKKKDKKKKRRIVNLNIIKSVKS